MIALSDESFTQVLEESDLSGNSLYRNSVKGVVVNITKAVETYLKQNGLEAYIEGYDWQYNVLISEELNAWCMPADQIAMYERMRPSILY